MVLTAAQKAAQAKKRAAEKRATRLADRGAAQTTQTVVAATPPVAESSAQTTVEVVEGDVTVTPLVVGTRRNITFAEPDVSGATATGNGSNVIPGTPVIIPHLGGPSTVAIDKQRRGKDVVGDGIKTSLKKAVHIYGLMIFWGSQRI